MHGDACDVRLEPYTGASHCCVHAGGVGPDAYRERGLFSTIFGIMLTVIFCFFCSLGGLRLLIVIKRYSLFVALFRVINTCG